MATKRRGPLKNRLAVMDVFLGHFSKEANLTRAAAVAGVERNTVYYWQEHDLDGFSARFHEAEAKANEAIEAEIHRRAITGTEKPVYQGGKRVGTIREYSDVLLIFLAKSRMAKYRDTTRHEHSGPGGGPIPVISLTDAEVERLAGVLRRLNPANIAPAANKEVCSGN